MSSLSSLFNGHFALAAASFTMLASGLALVTGDGASLASPASAQVGPQLEISRIAPLSWGPALGPVWQLDNAAPGDVVDEAVMLRTVDVDNPAEMYLTLRAELESTSVSAFTDALIVEEMRLGGANLLPTWLAQCGGPGQLTLSDLVECDGDARLPAPPEAGAEFRMAIAFAPGAGNVLQNAQTGPVTFYFDLWERDSPGMPDVPANPDAPVIPAAHPSPSPSPSPSPGPSATPTPDPGDGAEGPDDGPPTRTATPGEDGTAVPVTPPATTATPAPPDTGSGSDPSALRFGYVLIGLGALGFAAWCGLLDAGVRRRKNRAG